jgi:hypothetical protein
LPEFLEDICPNQGVTLSLNDYTATVCIQVDACKLIQEGDIWEFDDVYRRTTIQVDNKPTGRRVGPVNDYLVGCRMTDAEDNVLAQAGGPYEWCVHVPLEAGIHRVDVLFKRSDGETVSFAWTFELVRGPAPTSTPLPAPQEVDRVGHLPDYVDRVFPRPGEILLPARNLEEWEDLLESRGMPPVRLSTADMKPVCIALSYLELQELGAFLRDEHFHDRLYLTVDQGHPGDWLYPRFDLISGPTVAQCIETELAPGEHIATVYVDPLDTDLFVYSWAFTVEER